MTIEELIQLLAQHPPDLRVVVNGYEDGYDDLSPEQLSVVSIGLNVGETRLGRAARRPRTGCPIKPLRWCRRCLAAHVELSGAML